MGRAGRRRTSLVRIRFPFGLADRVDRLCESLRKQGKIPRAALVRAMLGIVLDDLTEAARDQLVAALNADTVRRGREKGPQPRRLSEGRPSPRALGAVAAMDPDVGVDPTAPLEDVGS